MNARDTVSNELLPVLREFYPRADGSDLLFTGAYDIVSPLPLKYGLDRESDIVYNIMNRVKLCGFPMFSRVWIDSGYIDFRLSDGAVEWIEVQAAAPCSVPDAFEIGNDTGYLLALLLTAADTAKPEDPAIPEGSVRRALLHAVFAASPSSRNTAIREAHAVVSEHRRAKPGSPERMGKKTTLALAAAFSQEIIPERSDKQ
ncbi:MAG: hypothetical protein J5586_00925 [Clostridia bacterium]|nr:hypothetical protein [Clostridia bacterium]